MSSRSWFLCFLIYLEKYSLLVSSLVLLIVFFFPHLCYCLPHPDLSACVKTPCCHFACPLQLYLSFVNCLRLYIFLSWCSLCSLLWFYFSMCPINVLALFVVFPCFLSVVLLLYYLACSLSYMFICCCISLTFSKTRLKVPPFCFRSPLYFVHLVKH